MIEVTRFIGIHLRILTLLALLFFQEKRSLPDDSVGEAVGVLQ
jgi:hypothetical protein